MTDESDALGRLAAFVGAWSVEASFPQFADSDLRGRTEFEWILGRRFLLQRSEVPHPEAPDSFSVIAVDAEHAAYTQHYFDSRGVVRTYAMTFDGGVWTLTRETPDFTPLEFSQRFNGTFDDDGTTIRGRWEICHDGTKWEHDFDLTYSKLE
ncbi:MAG: hypothetical protein ACRDY6_12905 [Acidimicrobiia bacterium]